MPSRLLRPWRLRRDIAAVVFTVPASDLARFDVALGPCVPLPGQTEPLWAPAHQAVGETPELTASLYTALTGRPHDETLVPMDASGPGRLSRFSASFVDAMVAANAEDRRLAREDDARGDEELTSFTRHHDGIADAWLRTGPWPREVKGTQHRLVRLAWARIAREEGQELYAWHGPSVRDLVVVSGSGPYPG